jgi:hypothetical protein
VFQSEYFFKVQPVKKIFRAVDPDSLKPDPDTAFQVNPDLDMDIIGSRVLMTKN